MTTSLLLQTVVLLSLSLPRHDNPSTVVSRGAPDSLPPLPPSMPLAAEPTQKVTGTPTLRPLSNSIEVEWRVPVGCDFSGFFVEVALGFVPHLAERLPVYLLHEGCPDSFLDSKLTATEAAIYRRLQRTDDQRSTASTKNSIVIEHGAACLARKFSAADRPQYLIARVMTEGVLPRDQAACMFSRGFDEYWVPTNYHIEVFKKAGFPADKLLVVPEPVDTIFFDPLQVSAKDMQGWRASAAVAVTSAAKTSPVSADDSARMLQPFVFCSVFKWEARKGWDTLISAYWSEFKSSNGPLSKQVRTSVPVLLRLRSYVPHWESGPRQIRTWLEQHAKRKYPNLSLKDLPPIEIFEQELSRHELRALYASSDAFVLPTKGEGWGLPVVEAMSMELPVIVTDYSGPAAYLTSQNSYPLRYRPSSSSTGGQVTPDSKHLRQLMRHVTTHRDEAVARGRVARKDMVSHYSPSVLLGSIDERLRNIALGRSQIISANQWNQGVRAQRTDSAERGHKDASPGAAADATHSKPTVARHTTAKTANGAMLASSAASTGKEPLQQLTEQPPPPPPPQPRPLPQEQRTHDERRSFSHGGSGTAVQQQGGSHGPDSRQVRSFDQTASGWVALWLGLNVLLCMGLIVMALDKENLKRRRWKQS